MDSIGTNITTALDVVRQIDEQASRMVLRIQILEKANGEQGDVIADLRHRLEQLDAENDRLNGIISERNDRINELKAALLKAALDDAEAKPTEREKAWAINQRFADQLHYSLDHDRGLAAPARAADAAYLIRQLGEHKRPVRFAQLDQQVVLHCAEIVAEACAAL